MTATNLTFTDCGVTQRAIKTLYRSLSERGLSAIEGDTGDDEALDVAAEQISNIIQNMEGDTQ